MKLSDFDGDSFRGVVEGQSFLCAANATSNKDFKLTEDRWIIGHQLILTNHSGDDTITAQVIDKDNVLGHGANFVLNTFVNNVPVITDTSSQGIMNFVAPGYLFAGVYIRISYTNTSLLNAVSLKLKLFTYKPLISQFTRVPADFGL